MRNGDFPDNGPADKLGRMLLLSMVFHLAVFGALIWYNAKTPKIKPVLPTYTVDLVNMPLPAPEPKTDVALTSPPPIAKPGATVQEKPSPTVRPAPAPQKAEAKKPSIAEKKPVVQSKPAASQPPPAAKTAPPKPKNPPKVAAPPPKVPAKPVAAVPKPAKPHTPAPALKPAAPIEKPAKTAAKAEAQVEKPSQTGAQTRAPAAKEKKSTPLADPPAKGTDPKARQQQIAQEIKASQQKVADADRDQTIKESVRNLEKGLAAKSRDQAYKEAVGQAGARLSAGKVSAKVSRGSGSADSGGAGSMGKAQTAAYGAQVSQTVRRHWQPNCLQRSNMQRMKAIIIVRIQADGSISASWFEKESGDRLFDQSAMTAVTRSSPLPPLPPGQEKLEIGITFTPEWKASS